MSFSILVDRCIDCGACEIGCEVDAIHPPAPDDEPQVFWIDTNRCNDCGWCPTVCPVDGIMADPETIICGARGCPVAPMRRGPVRGWECTRLVTLCESCRHVLWRGDGTTAWTCPRCLGLVQARCPKVMRGDARADDPRGRRASREPRAAR